MRKQPEITAKTRKKIVDSFWELYRNFRIEKISIGMLMKYAEMNRSTFYEYFTDIYDLLEQAENEILDSLQKYIDKNFNSRESITFNEFSGSFVRRFPMYDDKIYILMSSKGDPNFALKLKERIRGNISQILDMSSDSPEFEYILSFIIASLGGILSHWYENGKKESFEKVFNIMHTLMGTGVFGLDALSST